MVSAEAAARHDTAGLTTVPLSPREAFDVEMLAMGAFSPLTGFIGEADFQSVCRNMRLSNRVVWPIPIVLSPPDEVAQRLGAGQRIALTYEGKTLGLMTVGEKYKHDKAVEIPNVYRTDDDAHPGVKIVRRTPTMMSDNSRPLRAKKPSVMMRS